MSITLDQVVTIMVAVVLTVILKQILIHFFSPNKKVGRKEYEEDKKMLHERISRYKTIGDETFSACKKTCIDYTDRSIASQQSETKAIKELLETKLSALDRRFDDLMRFLKKE